MSTHAIRSLTAVLGLSMICALALWACVPRQAEPAVAPAAAVQRDALDEAARLEKTIAGLLNDLKVYTLDASPQDYAMTQYNLGVAYGRLSRVRDREANLQRALAAYLEALKVYTIDASPEAYARTQGQPGQRLH